MDERAAHAADARIGVDGDFDVPVLIALLRGRDEMLAAILDPLHRTPEQDRGKRRDDLFLIKNELRTKAAADVRRNDAHLILVAAEELAQKPHRDVRRLRRAVQREPVFDPIVRSDDAAAFDGMAAAAMLPERLAEDMRRASKGRLDIAVGHIEFGDQIVRSIVMDFRRAAFERCAAVCDGRQRLIVDIRAARPHPRPRSDHP